MASDGLWDVMPNDKVYDIVAKAMDGEREENFCKRLAKNLVLGMYENCSLKRKCYKRNVLINFSEARGTQSPDGYWEKKNGDLASGDDITCLVLPIKDIRDYLLGETIC